ncbi:hypothetical protein [Lysobacter gummosus]|uniref:hypothetical protein n=1 Tax=Lysobacter gummosus TaxID=262324 RepID=UPI00362DCAE8
MAPRFWTISISRPAPVTAPLPRAIHRRQVKSIQLATSPSGLTVRRARPVSRLVRRRSRFQGTSCSRMEMAAITW